MFNSSTFNNTFPIIYEDNNIAYSQLLEETNPFSYYDHLQLPLYYNDIENYVDFLTNHELTMIQQEPFQATNSSIITDDSSILEVTTTTKMDSSNNKGSGEVINGDMVSNNKPSLSRGSKRSRTCKKDRHSKIRTAHGLRDRRMRLSLKVASPFFKLQDMLGYDKGSRTVEWLLNMSKTAIDELVQSKNNGSVSGVTKCIFSSISDCEGESIVVEQKKTKNNINNNNSKNNMNNKGKKGMGNVAKEGNNKNNKVKDKRNRIKKEAMKKARDKARKRTLEKLQNRGLYNKDDATIHAFILSDCDEIMKGNKNTNDSYSMNHSSANWTNWSPLTNLSKPT
ncbi:hypothetical protein vseg_006769 [Gypsophila vaccaria]